MRVYEQVFDAGPQTVAQLEMVLGCSLEEAFAIYSGRQVSGLKPDSARKTTADAPGTRGSVKSGRFVERYPGKRLVGFEPTTFCMASSCVLGSTPRNPLPFRGFAAIGLVSAFQELRPIAVGLDTKVG
jgi:hypothetical protein